MITQDEATPYDVALQTNAAMAHKEFMSFIEWVQKMNLTEEEIIDSLKYYYNGFLNKYGGRAAAVAAEFYREVRKKYPNLTEYSPVAFPYTPDTSADEGLMEKNVKEGGVEQAAATAEQMMHRRIYEAADNTLNQNAMADPAHPKTRLIPHPGACAWCGLLALNEWDNGYETVPRHSDCKCYVVVDFDSDPNFENADKLLKPYRDAYEKVYNDANNEKWRNEYRALPKAVRQTYGDGSPAGSRNAYMRNRLLQNMNVALGHTEHTVIDG